MPKKATATTTGPRVMRLRGPGNAPDEKSASAAAAMNARLKAKKGGVDAVVIDFSKLEIKNDTYQIAVPKITADVPIIPFRRNKRVWGKTLPFLDFPSEIRNMIYGYYFADSDDTLDLDPENYKRYHKILGLMRVCRQISDEATHYFYSTHAFRVFPTHPHKMVRARKTILARLKPRQRQCIKTLDMRVGPGWNAPPKCWQISENMGLKDCVNATNLSVFVQCDPSDKIFKGFRQPDSFYEVFCRNLLVELIEAMPALRHVQFDGWSPVKKSGGMMSRLLEVVQSKDLTISWGPERGWTDGAEAPDTREVPTDADLELLDFLAHNGSLTTAPTVTVSVTAA